MFIGFGSINWVYRTGPQGTLPVHTEMSLLPSVPDTLNLANLILISRSCTEAYHVLGNYGLIISG